MHDLSHVTNLFSPSQGQISQPDEEGGSYEDLPGQIRRGHVDFSRKETRLSLSMD